MIDSVEKIKKGNEDAGLHYFSPDTMRFFRSRVMSRVFPVKDGAVFVTSERNDWTSSPRFYTVRRFYESTGEVETVDGFQAYATYSGAMKGAERAANEIDSE